MPYYKDLRQFLMLLEERGKLIRITREINKDTQLAPLARLQFRGLPEEERKGFLFENVVDSRGRKYFSPVAWSVVAASTEIYGLGLMCSPEDIGDKWVEAQLHPIEPRIVDSAPVQEEVHIGDTLLQHGGLDEFPIPISTPGFDPAPFFTSPFVVTKDPDTGIRNVGTYRCHLKSPTRAGVYPSHLAKHIGLHWKKCRERKIPLEAAIVIGGAPNIAYVSVSPLPQGTDEFAVAGGLAGEAVELVKCKTVALEVPAHAEIVIEGEISTTELEPEAPFGEANGYLAGRGLSFFLDVKAITHRHTPIWQGFLSQFPPSESSKIRKIGREYAFYKTLRYDLGMSHVTKVALPEATGAMGMIVVQMKRTEPAQVWRTLETLAGFGLVIVIGVNEDINPWDPDMVNWAMSFRVEPARDIRVITTEKGAIEHRVGIKPGYMGEEIPQVSRLLIDATMKTDLPPISLPKKEFMEEALWLWQQMGLPALKLKEPWWGYNLGFWSDEWEEEAQLAVKGEYYRTGEKLAARRQPPSL